MTTTHWEEGFLDEPASDDPERAEPVFFLQNIEANPGVGSPCRPQRPRQEPRR